MSKRREELLRQIEIENRRSSADGVFFFQALAERSGMNLTDLQCITILTSTGPVSAGQLAEMMGLTTGAITGLVNRLEQAGYVRRAKDPDDARRVVVQPVTEALDRVGARFFSSQEEALDALTAGYDDEGLAVLVDFMRKANAYTRKEIARIRTGAGEHEEGQFSSSLDEVERGRLVFANGISRLVIRGAAGLDTLYHARFEGSPPNVTEDHGTVTFRYPRRFKGLFDWGSHSGEVSLSDAVPWEIEVRGGAARVETHLETLQLTSLAITGGMSDCHLTLPEPSGAVPVRVTGGMSKVSIHRPATAQAKLSVKGGVGKLTFDEQHFDAIGGKVQLQSTGYDATPDRYEIEISGGASEITVQQATEQATGPRLDTR